MFAEFITLVYVGKKVINIQNHIHKHISSLPYVNKYFVSTIYRFSKLNRANNIKSIFIIK